MDSTFLIKVIPRFWSILNTYLVPGISEVKSLSHVRFFATPWTAAYQAPLSMGFSRQEYWSGVPFPSPGHLPNPGIEPRFPVQQAHALPSEPPGNPGIMYHAKGFKLRKKLVPTFQTGVRLKTLGVRTHITHFFYLQIASMCTTRIASRAYSSLPYLCSVSCARHCGYPKTQK